MTAQLQQRCWNHEEREAVCRCLDCKRSFCRECVSEHQGRLLCAVCLNNATRGVAARRKPFQRLMPIAMVAAGLLLAWVVLFGAGESLLLLAERAEQTSWQNH